MQENVDMKSWNVTSSESSDQRLKILSSMWREPNFFPIPSRQALGVHVRRRAIVYYPSCSSIGSGNSSTLVLAFRPFSD